MINDWDETDVDVTIVVTRRYCGSSEECVKDDIDAMIELMMDSITCEKFVVTNMDSKRRMLTSGESND